MITLIPYDPAWPKAFAAIAAPLQTVLQGMARWLNRHRQPLRRFAPRLAFALSLVVLAAGAAAAKDEYLAGCLIIPTGPKVAKDYKAGFSMNVAAGAKNRNYLPPPTLGKLANIDPALIVHPPRGLEIGYVPIATRQELVGQLSRR